MDPLSAVAVGVVVFGILMVSVVGVGILGNRPAFFLFGEITPALAFAVLLVGLLLLQITRPRTVPAAARRLKPTRQEPFRRELQR